MSSWSHRRQFVYGSGLLLFIFAILGTGLYSYFHKAPTCFDGIKNGDEQGIDCGGSCGLYCPFQVVDPVILWQRMSKISTGVYNVIAYVENPNPLAKADSVPYLFKLYDDQGILVASRNGSVTILPNKPLAIFETGLQAGSRIPIRVTFEFLAKPVWVKALETENPFAVRNIVLSKASSTPRIDATIQNLTVNPISNIQLVAIVFDQAGNAEAFSNTFIDTLSSESSQNVVFTWRLPFPSPAAKINIIPQILPASQ